MLIHLYWPGRSLAESSMRLHALVCAGRAQACELWSVLQKDRFYPTTMLCLNRVHIALEITIHINESNCEIAIARMCCVLLHG